MVFSAVEMCQPVGNAESGRFGQLVVVVELAAPTVPLLLGARWRRTGAVAGIRSANEK